MNTKRWFGRLASSAAVVTALAGIAGAPALAQEATRSDRLGPAAAQAGAGHAAAPTAVSLPADRVVDGATAEREARIWQQVEADLRAGRAPEADVLLVETDDGPALLLVRNDLVDNLRLLRARDLPLATVYD